MAQQILRNQEEDGDEELSERILQSQGQLVLVHDYSMGDKF